MLFLLFFVIVSCSGFSIPLQQENQTISLYTLTLDEKLVKKEISFRWYSEPRVHSQPVFLHHRRLPILTKEKISLGIASPIWFWFHSLLIDQHQITFNADRPKGPVHSCSALDGNYTCTLIDNVGHLLHFFSEEEHGRLPAEFLQKTRELNQPASLVFHIGDSVLQWDHIEQAKTSLDIQMPTKLFKTYSFYMNANTASFSWKRHTQGHWKPSCSVFIVFCLLYYAYLETRGIPPTRKDMGEYRARHLFITKLDSRRTAQAFYMPLFFVVTAMSIDPLLIRKLTLPFLILPLFFIPSKTWQERWIRRWVVCMLPLETIWSALLYLYDGSPNFPGMILSGFLLHQCLLTMFHAFSDPFWGWAFLRLVYCLVRVLWIATLFFNLHLQAQWGFSGGWFTLLFLGMVLCFSNSHFQEWSLIAEVYALIHGRLIPCVGGS